MSGHPASTGPSKPPKPEASAQHPAGILDRVREQGWSLELEALPPLGREAVAASHVIYTAVHPTPLRRSDWLSEAGSCSVLLKLEIEQVTGSFKARGAANKVFGLSKEEVGKGLVTASSGNHALAFVYACRKLADLRGPDWATTPLVYLPEGVSPAKRERLEASGAHLAFAPTGGDAETRARADAHASGKVYVSPYNDIKVVGGQGTIALELLADLGRGGLDAVFVPVGGGGLIAGIASLLKGVDPSIQIIGCQPAADDAMRQCVVAGRVVDVDGKETLSDGTAGNVEEGSITLQPCMEYVDTWVTVDEAEIAHAMLDVLARDNLRIEGAAATTVAAFLRDPAAWQGKHVVLIMCGGNVSDATLDRARLVFLS